MRRFLTAVAGAAIASAVVASGASALQVLPSSDAGANGQWPARPYFATSEIVTRGASGSVVIHGSCFGALTSSPSTPALNPGELLGEYPYGGIDTQPSNGVVGTGAPDYVGAFPNGPSDLGLDYEADVWVIGDTPADNNFKATGHPGAANNNPLVTYRGHVEYLVYSDSYSTGPIDLDATPINGDGSFDIRLSTAGLGQDTYTVRFLGCREMGAQTNEVTRTYNVNYYQGTPITDDVFTNVNLSSNAPGATSYVPTNVRAANDPAFPGTAGQVALGYDTYRCTYDAFNVNPGPWNSATWTVEGYPEVSGRGPNEFGKPNGEWAFADNFSCPTYNFVVPFDVLPLTSGYNGNGDFSCLNRYNNTQPYGGAIYGTTQENPIGPVGGGTASQILTSGNTDYLHQIVAHVATGGGANGTGAAVSSSLVGCPSGYDPVGIRANSIYDFYGRFQVVAPAAATPAATPAPTATPAFVAPTNTQAAAAAEQATINIISTAGGTPTNNTTSVNVTNTPAAATNNTQAAAVNTQTPVAAAVATQTPVATASAPAAQAPTTVATPAGVSVKAPSVQARVLAPAKSATVKKTAPKASAKVVAKATSKTVVKAGATCSKAGATATAGAQSFSCVKSGAKLVWKVTPVQKATTAKK